MAKRQVFFSFHFDKDVWRAGQVKNMGVVDNSSTWSSNDWEEVKEKSDTKIKEWIDATAVVFASYCLYHRCR